jgi:hypothetical protein
MMSPETISYLARKQARAAAKNGSKPLIIEAEDMPRIESVIRHMPNIGTYRPRGYRLVEHFMVDKSGFGAENEPALTFAELCRRVKAGMAYAIIEEGQFQVVVGEFAVKRVVHIDPALRVPLPPLPPIPSEPVVRILKQTDILKCPHVILMPEHYREDGSCKCDDAVERARMIKEWGYKKKDFTAIPLRG